VPRHDDGQPRNLQEQRGVAAEGSSHMDLGKLVELRIQIEVLAPSPAAATGATVSNSVSVAPSNPTETSAAATASLLGEQEHGSLAPSRKKAYQQFLWSISTAPQLAGATDRQVYDWLLQHSDEDEPPVFSTWSRYLREARAFYGTRKNNRRAGRETGRSVVRATEI